MTIRSCSNNNKNRTKQIESAIVNKIFIDQNTSPEHNANISLSSCLCMMQSMRICQFSATSSSGDHNREGHDRILFKLFSVSVYGSTAANGQYLSIERRSLIFIER